MGHKELSEFNPNETLILRDKLLKGVVSRASVLSLMFATAFIVYSFTSYEFLKSFKPDLTLLDNTWPRVLFNGVPLIIMGIWFRNYEQNFVRKAWAWTVGLPLVFVAACCIHVWPILWSGKPEVYLYVHAANVFIIVATLVVTAPPPKYLAATIMAFVLFFLTPLCFFLTKLEDEQVLKLALGDLLIVFPASAYAAHTTYKLRLKIAKFDMQMKKMASPFLGTALADAIYNQRSHLLKDRSADSIVVLMDIRGYTDFYKNNDIAIVRQFMSAYHGMVSRLTGQFGGYWHKSIGDAQLVSFGAMDEEADLSDIPGIESELVAARERKLKDRYENALRAVTTIAFQFEELKAQFDIEDNISLGIAIDHGELQIRVQGDDTHKKELDIDGRVIIRCSRLEAYTKIIRKSVAPDASVLILSPDLEGLADRDRMFHTWNITDPNMKIPNFPEIAHVLYHVFRNKDERRSRVRKLRAS